MAYLFGKHIPPHKTLLSALTQIYGIGCKRALEIANFLCVNPGLRAHKLDNNHIVKLSKYVSTIGELQVGGKLQKNVEGNIGKKIKIKSYQGIRHRNKLPVRGQRTHTNAKTQRKSIKIKFI